MVIFCLHTFPPPKNTLDSHINPPQH
jgi:hypothetical protein